MNKEEMPKFIQNYPHGFDKYEGKSGERVADAIHSHISSYNDSVNLPKIIGLEGEWGSGKSNIIKILTKKLGENYFLFEYDAWGHQEDLQRRSFLESLTTRLIEVNIENKIFAKNATIKTKDGNEEIISWQKKLKYLLAKKIETETISYPKVGVGVAVSFFTAILTPIFVFIAYATKSNQGGFWATFMSIVISMLPVITSFIIWRIYVYKYPVKYKNLEFFLSVYQDKLVEGIEFETINEDEPSVSEFKEWMKDLSGSLAKSLVIVYDNMDRLPANKVKELWSSIHTFFSDNSYENIWVIIPFDRQHLANAFGENSDGNGSKLTCHFINKTFPVIYRVPPPILTDWKKAFNEFFEEAFGAVENENIEVIQQVFGIIRIQFTPRDIIAFINEIVSLKRTWKDEIPLLYIAIFALKKDGILNTPEISILSGEYLKSVHKVITNNEETQRFISALTYGIDLNLAEQIPLKEYLQKTFKGTPGYDINKYTEHKHFITFLKEEVGRIDLATLDNGIHCLSKLDTSKGISLTNQWNALTKLQLEQKLDKCTFEDTYKILLLNSDDANRNELAEYLCGSYKTVKEFKGDVFYTTMQALDVFIKENKLNITIANYITELQVSPELFIEYIREAKENYGLYKLGCENKLLNDYLINLMQTGKLPVMDFIALLKEDELYSFDDFKTRIENAISGNEITAENFAEIFKTYKIISKEKPLKQKFTTAQIPSLITATTDKTSETYYDLVAMGLCQSIDTSSVGDLDERVAERIEYYCDYGSLLILSVNWESDLLRKAIKKLTLKPVGKSSMVIETVLPSFESIKIAIGVTDAELLLRLSPWSKYAEQRINDANIMTVIPDYNFYKYSTATKNNLTNFLNKTAISKLSTIPVDELYSQHNIPSYYWLNCTAYLVQGNSLASLPDNLLELCKRVLADIAAGSQAIPLTDSVLDIIIRKANKNKLQPTIKSICDDFCNKTKSITPAIFAYFVTNFDFVNKMTLRDGDITRNILNVVITDANCLNLILKSADGYIKKIKKAGIDAEDLKSNIRTLLNSNKSNELQEFANAIGVKDEQNKNEDV